MAGLFPHEQAEDRDQGRSHPSAEDQSVTTQFRAGSTASAPQANPFRSNFRPPSLLPPPQGMSNKPSVPNLSTEPHSRKTDRPIANQTTSSGHERAEQRITSDASCTSSSSSNSRGAGRIVLLDHASKEPLTPGSPGFKFNMITALTSHTDILINIIRYTPPRSLVYLYSISAPFHYIMDSHFTQFILSNTKTWAPGAEFFYPWRCYRELCIHDPAMRRRSYEHRENFVDRRTGRKSDEWNAEQQHEAMALHGADFGIKPVPSLRWLKMVVYREFVSREIVAWLAVKGHRTPVRATIDAVKKMWFLIDIPVSAPRVALIHNTAYFTNQTLYALTMLFLKLDMYHTDPICYTGGEAVMREYLLQERSLTTLWNHLRDADGTTRLDTVRLYVKHGYRRPLRHGPETLAEQIENDEKAKMPIMGIPAHLVGRWGYECWGLGGQRLIRPDELVLREGIRRGMEMQKMWIRMMLWGYLDKDLKDVEKVEKENVVLSLIRRRKKMEQKEREARWAREAEEIDEGGASGAGACVQEENDKMEMD